MKAGVWCATVLTALVAQQASAAYRNSCFGGRCGFQSGNQGYQSYQPRYSQNRYQNQYQNNNNYNSRFGPSRTQYSPSPNRFSPSTGGFSSHSSQFSSSPSQFRSSPSQFSSSPSHFSSSRSHFSSPPSQFGSGQRQFSSSSSSSQFSSPPSNQFSSQTSNQFSSPSNQFGASSRRFNSGRFGLSPRQNSFQSRFASTTPEQRYQAQLATNRQLGQQRRQEQHLLQTRTGIVQPGTPSAALAAEKRADPKSLALGNQALQQILYLQNLVGAGRRR